MYSLYILKAVRKDLKRLSKQATVRIVNFCLPQLAKSPCPGTPLSGDLKGYWKYVFKFKGVSYRIAYQIYEKEKMILIVAIGPREKFYEKLMRKVR